MRVERKQNPYSWQPSASCHKNLAIWKTFFPKSGEFGAIFPWKILCVGLNHIFQFEIFHGFVCSSSNWRKAQTVGSNRV
jgi:hypothetical protein